jgi:hypothetical protein
MRYFLLCLFVASSTLLYSQESDKTAAALELRQFIQRKVEPPMSMLSTQKSAIVPVSIRLTKQGKYVSSTLLYNDSSDIARNVHAVLEKVKPSTWKRFKGAKNIMIPIYFSYDDGGDDFTFDWSEFDSRKMKKDHLEGLYLKPVIILVSKQERMR